MERVQLNNKEGKPVYVSFDCSNKDYIIQLQKKLLEHFSYTPIPKNQLHLTVFHFGKPESLLNEVSRHVPNLYQDHFKPKFIKFQNSLVLPQTEIELTPRSLDVFGKPKSPILVIRYEKTEKLISLRKKIFENFCEFLKELGVKNVYDFMSQSENLKYQIEENYKPHISIGYL